MAIVRQEARGVARPREVRRKSLRARIWRERWMYPFIIPGIIYFIVFSYVPLLGNVAAFQDFSPFLGFARSPWVGFQNFVNIMSNPSFFKPLLVLQSIWKDIGWGTIIFLAAISKVDANLYEAAVMDGAGPWKRMWHITLPGIRSVVVLLLVLKMGSLLSVGFEQILLQEPAVGADAGQVLSTFVYYRGVVGGDWGFATAVGLLEGIVGTVMIVSANRMAHWFGEEGVF